jgi:hypothetical protein
MSPNIQYILQRLESLFLGSIFFRYYWRCSKLGGVQCHPGSKFLFFQCPDYFVVGYGLDYAELYRNLPYVGVLKPEMYKKDSSN